MAFNEKLAGRVRQLLSGTSHTIDEKRMFMGLCFMVNDKICVCVHSKEIMVRLDQKIAEKALKKSGTRQMMMKDRIMKGYIAVDESALKTKRQLEYWVNMALDFNPFASSSKKKKTD